jgi:hypothetical protein
MVNVVRKQANSSSIKRFWRADFLKFENGWEIKESLYVSCLRKIGILHCQYLANIGESHLKVRLMMKK